MTCEAEIKGNGIKFFRLQFNSRDPGVDKVEVEGPNGDTILVTVHLSAVATEIEGRAIAAKVSAAALDRLSFGHNVAIEQARETNAHFSPLAPQPGVLTVNLGHLTITGSPVRLVLGLPTDGVRAELERTSPPGAQYFGLFRSARQSPSAVEEFLHLYHILLLLFADSQSAVDRFITNEDPAVPQTQHPMKAAGVLETIYTRLRNEFAHRRAGVDLEDTKMEMARRLPVLITLTRTAIESCGP